MFYWSINKLMQVESPSMRNYHHWGSMWKINSDIILVSIELPLVLGWMEIACIVSEVLPSWIQERRNIFRSCSSTMEHRYQTSNVKIAFKCS